MGKTKKAKQGKSEGAPGVPSNHAIFAKPLPAVKHGLHLDLLGANIDGRTRLGRALRDLTRVLLDRFPAPAPAVAQVIAQRAAFKLIRAASYESFILKGGKTAPTAEAAYLHLTGSIRLDLSALWNMARDGQPEDKPPTLAEYLKALKENQLIDVGGKK